MGKNVAKSFSNKFPLQLIRIPTLFVWFSKLFPSSSRNPISASIKNLPCLLSSLSTSLLHSRHSLFAFFIFLFIYPIKFFTWHNCHRLKVFHSSLRRHNWSSCKTNLETLRGWRRWNLEGGCSINYESHDKVPARFCVVSKFFRSIKWDFQVKSVRTGAGAVTAMNFGVSIVKFNDGMTLQHKQR